MDAAARRAGRRPDEVSLLAVTKYAPLETVTELLSAGAVGEIGESRVQDALRRRRELGALARKVRWRLIGHLQSNKARLAAESFDSVDSIDDARTGEALERRLAALGKSLPVLVQVKLTERETQSGVAPGEAPRLVRQLSFLPSLKVEGLMGIAPAHDSPEAARPAFRRLKQVFDEIFAGRPGARLSMGMSHDFEVAIEEGATMVRIGAALFSMANETTTREDK